ncbi:MAG: hypothetical protein PSV35_02790 [bacterium]|nr:hypothetical protein [bacterium]
MKESENRFTTELFPNKDAAEIAYQHALDQGYTTKDINVVMSEDSRKRYYASPLVTEQGDKSMEGLAMGGATGGAVVGIVAAIAAIGTSLVIPGLGLVVAGPLAAGLAGAGAGSVAGGLVGALIGWGIPEERVKEYESGIKSGGIVLGVDETLPHSNLSDDWRRYKI